MRDEKIQRFREYLEGLERAENTINNYCESVKIYFQRYDTLSRKNMLDFKRWQLETWKPKTANNRVVAMNQYCMCFGHPECCVKSIKIHNATVVENVITIEEYKRLLEGLKADGNEKGYYMIQYLAKTGARISEFVRLKKAALDLGYCELWTKGKIRRIYIPESLIEESRSYLMKQPTEYLFCSQRGTQMSTRGVDSRLKYWAKKYGIRKEVMHPHSFRHLYAIEFLKHNSNLSLLADLMGHSDVGTTSIYLKLSKEEQMKQFNAASNW